MDSTIIQESERMFKELVKLGKFGSRYKTYPYNQVSRLVSEMRELAQAIPEIETPENQSELHHSELKRRLTGEAVSLEANITPTHHDFDKIISIYGIPKEDIDSLEAWLLKNRDDTIDAVERLYTTEDIRSFELGLPSDIPGVRRQSEEFAAVHIQKYHNRLGKLLQDLTKVGGFLRDISAVPTTEARSYFHPLTKTLAIGIPAICFTSEDGSLHVRERDLITLYGHEGMGHALNQVVTKEDGLPSFLTQDTMLTAATQESVAQFYEQVIFEDLKRSPETQKDLGIEHKFDRIYQEAKDVARLNQYRARSFHYAITVLADKSIGQPQDSCTLLKKAELLNRVMLDPAEGLRFVEQHRYSFDSQGNLNPKMVSELRYCARPVQRALDEFARQGITYDGQGRSRIDATLLRGFWTPIGYVDNARLSAVK